MVQEASEVGSRIALAELLCGQRTSWPSTIVLSPEEWLDRASEEDVVALVDRRLRDGLTGFPPALGDLFSQAARGEAAQSMLRQAEARRILMQFSEAGLPVLLLKGSALAWWVYPAPHLRRCADVDLLFASRDDALAAAALLAGDGYVVRQHFGQAATREFLCRRDAALGSVIELDMHWSLSSAPVFAERLAFPELMAASIPLPALAPCARGLGPVHACLHACMHRASDLSNGGGEKLKWLYDLHLLAGVLAPADWESLRALAAERGLAGVCANGLEESARLFSTPLPAPTMAALRHASKREMLAPARLRDWKYFQLQNLRALPDWTSRARWIWQRLLPTADYRQDTGVRAGGLVRDRIRRALRQVRR